MQEDVVIVVSGGGPPDAPVPTRLPAGRVVAADGGVDRALALGLEVDLAVGDFDSASPRALADAEASGARIERHPTEKDATDLELALDAALAYGAARVLVVGHDGGRLDHLLAGVLVLGEERFARLTIDAYLGLARLHVCRGTRTLDGEPGELVTLLPIHGTAEGVRTEGLVFPLHGETLRAGSSRGASNELSAPSATVTVERGVLLAVFPGTRDGR